MSLINDVHIFVTDPSGEGVHGHRAEVYDEGMIAVSLHQECVPRTEMFAVLAEYQRRNWTVHQAPLGSGETVYIFYRTTIGVTEALDCVFLALESNGEMEHTANEIPF